MQSSARWTLAHMKVASSEHNINMVEHTFLVSSPGQANAALESPISLT